MKNFKEFISEAVQSKNDLESFLVRGAGVKDGMYVYYKKFPNPSRFHMQEILNLFSRKTRSDITQKTFGGNSDAIDFSEDLELGIRFMLIFNRQTKETWVFLWRQHTLHEVAINLIATVAQRSDMPEIDWKAEFQKNYRGAPDNWLMFLAFVLNQDRKFGTNMGSKRTLDLIKASELSRSIL